MAASCIKENQFPAEWAMYLAQSITGNGSWHAWLLENVLEYLKVDQKFQKISKYYHVVSMKL